MTVGMGQTLISDCHIKKGKPTYVVVWRGGHGVKP